MSIEMHGTTRAGSLAHCSRQAWCPGYILALRRRAGARVLAVRVARRRGSVRAGGVRAGGAGPRLRRGCSQSPARQLECRQPQLSAPPLPRPRLAPRGRGSRRRRRAGRATITTGPPDPDGAAVHLHGSGRCSPSGPGGALVRWRLLGVAVAANGSNGRFPRLPRTRRGGWSSALGGLEKKAAAASGQEEQRQRLVHGTRVVLASCCVCVCCACLLGVTNPSSPSSMDLRGSGFILGRSSGEPWVGRRLSKSAMPG